MDSSSAKFAKTAVVKEAIAAYHWYADSRVCGCANAQGTWETGLWKEENGVRRPVLCRRHEWTKHRDDLAALIMQSGLSYPPSKIINRDDAYKQAMTIIYADLGGMRENPLTCHHPTVRVKQGGGVAGSVAAWMSREYEVGENTFTGGHAPFFVYHSQVKSLTFSGREFEIEDVLLYAPVLLYRKDSDPRANGDRFIEKLTLRQYGYCVILED